MGNCAFSCVKDRSRYPRLVTCSIDVRSREQARMVGIRVQGEPPCSLHGFVCLAIWMKLECILGCPSTGRDGPFSCDESHRRRSIHRCLIRLVLLLCTSAIPGMGPDYQGTVQHGTSPSSFPLFLSPRGMRFGCSLVPTPTSTSLLLGLSPTLLPPAPISRLTFRKNNHDSCFGLVLLPFLIPEDRFLSKPNPSLSTSPFSLSNLPFRNGMPPARSPLLSDRGSNLLPSPQRTPLLSPFFLCALRSDGEERTHQGRSLC